ncbi:TPA: FAD-dependent oxidoreductase [Campylobacter jejuni]|nr:FAD-dependent oxidoreductase [Campylobacter jejuni]HEC1716292.1 FAD-dependent oxidoreductase [Campylobacter jejuni]
MEETDVIVVGGGISGLTCAYVLAQEGLSVVLLERADIASKNVSGGRLYAHTLRDIKGLEDFDSACERVITCEKLGFLDDKNALSIESRKSIDEDKFANSYSIIQSKFLNYLANKCEDLGVMIASNVLVDTLLIENEKKEILLSSDLNRTLNANEKIVGIKSGEDEMMAKMVVLAEGVNSLLAQSINLNASSDKDCGFVGKNYALGIKEVIELNVNERFALSNNEGLAALFAGSASDYQMGGGFLYTNENSISLGCVIGLGTDFNKASYEVFEQFKKHPMISALIKDAKSVEYSAHLVPEGGYNALSDLGANGVLVVGDAAGFCINLGYTVRGMDLCIMSAKCAARAITKAFKQNSNALNEYKNELFKQDAFLDMKDFASFGEFLEHNPRIFNEYPKALNELFIDIFKVDGKTLRMKNKIMKFVKKIGFMNLLKDVYKGGKSL